MRLAQFPPQRLKVRHTIAAQRGRLASMIAVRPSKYAAAAAIGANCSVQSYPLRE